MPKVCKEVFHPCTIETMHIIIFLLVVTQFLTTNKWHSSMDAALVGAIIHGVPNKGDKIRSGYLNPAFSGVTSKIWHIPNAQEALKTQLWNNKIVEKGQN